MRKLFLFSLILVCQVNLYAQNKIHSYEYWFDNDYAQKVQTLINPVSTFLLISNISVNTLTSGLHTYNIRFRDDSSRFSAVTNQFFIKLPQSTNFNKQIVAYEYWFDNNYSQKILQPVSPQDALQLVTNLNADVLNDGLHNINVRFKDNAGLWSSTISQFLVKSPQSTNSNKQIVAYEYWFDNNYSQKILQAVAPQSQFQLVNNFDAGALDDGLHNINIRFKDNTGLWSSTVSQFLVKSPQSQTSNKQVVAYEYWFDNNYLQKVFQSVSPQSAFQLVTNFNAGALDDGLHNINIRIKDNAGLWSSTVTQFLVKSPQSPISNKQIGAYEYWFDNNYSQKILQSVTPQSAFQLITNVNTDALNDGLHNIKIRFKDNAGLWSTVVNQYVVKAKATTGNFNVITGYRYWFDMKSTSIVQVNLSFPTNPYLLVTNINATSLDTGFHSVQFQFRDTNGLWSVVINDTFYQVGKPQLYSILPNNGGNIGDVTVNISGNGFFAGTKVKLTRAGYPDISVPDSLILIEQGKNIRATIDLRNKPLGLWNLVVTVPNDTIMTIVNGFKIDSGVVAAPYANIIGFDRIRLNTWQTYTIVYGNQSNINATGVPLWLAIEGDTTTKIELDFKIFQPTDTISNFYDSIPLFLDIDSLNNNPFKGKVYPFIIANIPPGTIGTLNFKIKISNNNGFKLATWTDPPLYGSPLKPGLAACIDDIVSTGISFVPGYGCFYNLIRKQVDPFISEINNPHNGPGPLMGSYLWGTSLATLSCVIEFVPGLHLAKTLKTIFKSAKLLKRGYDIYQSCSPIFTPEDPLKSPVTIVNSFDPNEKLGPLGSGEKQYRPAGAPYPYVIHFENADSATAPAQIVLITDTLDQNVFDVNSIELGFIKIGDTIINLLSGLKAYHDYIDLRPKRNFILETKADYNDTTGVLSWKFTSLDPLTYLPVVNPLDGFLPPNVTAPEGEGSVFYTIRLKDSLNNGTLISNKACIYFDDNPAICTSLWVNTIDNIKPNSKVDSLPSPLMNIVFTVMWSGSDSGSGVKDYSIYYSTNGGAYQPWLIHTKATSATFTGEADSTYRFYSVALDSAGNLESAPLVADATTTIIKTFTWTGLTSNDWMVKSNWSGGFVPEALNDVTIPAGTLFSPTIPAGQNVSCRSLSILPGAVITIGTNAHLNVMP